MCACVEDQKDFLTSFSPMSSSSLWLPMSSSSNTSHQLSSLAVGTSSDAFAASVESSPVSSEYVMNFLDVAVAEMPGGDGNSFSLNVLELPNTNSSSPFPISSPQISFLHKDDDDVLSRNHLSSRRFQLSLSHSTPISAESAESTGVSFIPPPLHPSSTSSNTINSRSSPPSREGAAFGKSTEKVTIMTDCHLHSSSSSSSANSANPSSMEGLKYDGFDSVNVSEENSFISGLETEGTFTDTSTADLGGDNASDIKGGQEVPENVGSLNYSSSSFSMREQPSNKILTRSSDIDGGIRTLGATTNPIENKKSKREYVLFNPYNLRLIIRLWLEFTAAPFLILWVYFIYFVVLIILAAPYARQIVWLNATVAGFIVGMGLNANAYRAIMYRGSPDYGMIFRFFMIPFGVSAMSGLTNSMREKFMLVFPKNLYHLTLAVTTPTVVVCLLLLSRLFCLWRFRVPITMRNVFFNGRICE